MTFDNNTSIPEICLRLLALKGLKESQEIADFLYPKLKDLPKPELMKGLSEATQLIVDYLENGLQIVIWGDYDVDGTTSTGLLVNFFRELGIEVLYHIPNRLTEGYGLNVEWFKENRGTFTSKKFLLITVDCGIANREEVQQIQKLDGEVIVTDHHSIPLDGLPDCIVLNPSQADCGFHQEKLAGVGVAFYLAAGIRSRLLLSPQYKDIVPTINLKKYLAFVALGTVADLVYLTTTNRILVRAGLESLKDTPFTGLSSLLESCELYGDQITSEDIGYLLGPKINAAGRLGNSEIAIKLFTARSATEAKKAVGSLEKLNSKRKTICEDDLETALSTCSKTLIAQSFSCVCSGNFHLGVAGIVASRLVEEFRVPSIVFAEYPDLSGDEYLKGSVRSIEGISVIDALNDCSDLIVKFGGHDMAAGLTILQKDLDEFRKYFSKSLKRQRAEMTDKKSITAAFETSVDQVMDNKTLECLHCFEPYGPGNDAPVFRDRSSKVIQARTVGRLNSHLNIVVRGEYSNYKGIGFNLGDKISEVQENPERTIYFVPTKNRYRGTVSWQLRVVDLL
jgi:single-stranded-DNA-specific exonuclease